MSWAYLTTFDNTDNDTPFNWPESPYAWTPASEGSYCLMAEGTDNAGNLETTAYATNVVYDTTAPLVQITNPSDGDLVNGTVNIQGSVTDDNLWRYWFVVQNSGGTTVAGPGTVYHDGPIVNVNLGWDTTAVPDGDYTIKLEARDKADNKDPIDSVHWITVTVDNTAPPTPSLVWPSDGAVIHPSIAILDWTDETDPHGPVTYNYQSSWSGGSYGPVSTGTNSFINATGSADNTYFWQVQACDSLNNCSAWSSPWEVTIDSTPPYSTFFEPTDNSYHNSPIAISGQTADDGSGVDYVDISWTTYNGASCDDLGWTYLTTFNNTDNDTPFNWPESPYAWTPASEGSYCLMAEGTDNAGNLETTAYATNVVYDTTAPYVEITDPLDGQYVNGTVDIWGFIIDDNLSHYNIAIYPGGVDTWNFSERLEQQTVYTSEFGNSQIYSWDTTIYPDGDYQIRLAARDLAGNRDPMTPSYPNEIGDSVHIITVTVDNTAPTAMFANQSVDETVTSWPGYSLLVSSEPIVNINCSTLETLPRNAETLPNPVAFNCTFEDLAGNLGTSSYTVTVNDIVPSVVVNPSSITVTTADPAVTLTATGSGGNAPLTYSWSGACAGSSSTTTAPSTVGTHVCTVTVTDADGDTASATATVTVNPASTPPAGGQPGTGAGGGTVGTQVTVLGAETGGEGEVNGDAESDEQEEDGEVLGEEECENKSKVRGYIYYDNNDNDQKDKGEEGLESIEVKIYLEKDGEKDVVTTERTDENGYWEAEVCPGEYKAEINKDDLPENVALSSDEVLGLSVKEDEEMNDINFTVKKTQGIDFSWWWCLVPLAIVALVYLASKFFKPKEEQDVKVGM
ncbi:PKD domain-containing protein [Candidatus Dojkabacteria bacterium]|nr:PKD domain-containing protein [Candidatus Dojkabacteria bacterium]